MKLRHALTAVAVAVGALTSLSASALTSEGVIYTTSYASLGGDAWELTLGIDARNNEFGATALTAVAINPLIPDTGTFSDVVLVASPAPVYGSWVGHSGGLPDGDSPTCNGEGKAFFCFDNTDGGALTSAPMEFKFDFTGTGIDLTGPTVKVAWLDTMNNNTYALDGGHHLSVQVPVPEPETYALFLAGLATIGFMTRRRMS